VNESRELARHAYNLAQRQLALLQQDSFEAFDAGFDELERIYTALLRTPLEEFDDETEALAQELVPLQRSICEELDSLMSRAGDAIHANKRGRTVIDAYRPTPAGLPAPRTV
jgi:hypothetical protein